MNVLSCQRLTEEGEDPLATFTTAAAILEFNEVLLQCENFQKHTLMPGGPTKIFFFVIKCNYIHTHSQVLIDRYRHIETNKQKSNN